MAYAQVAGSRFPPSIDGADDLRALRDLSGVEAIFRSRDGRVLYAVVREHSAVDWDRLVEVEQEIQAAGAPDVTISVRAHQGREPRVMFEGLEQL